MLLTNSWPKPHFWKQLIIVSADSSLQATCSQWTAFAILKSCIISQVFLHSSIRETTYFSSLFLYLHLNVLIMPASRGSNREVVHFSRKISLMFLKLFWSVSGWKCGVLTKRMVFLHSSWTLRSTSLSTSSIISVLIRAFHLRNFFLNEKIFGLVLSWMFLKHLGDLLV